jgi:DnaJ like chaperone protein
MTIILIGSAIGYFIAGSQGFFIGGIVAYVIGQVLRSTVLNGAQVMQSQFLESTFAIMGALCKADGVVSRDEIQVAEETFRRLHLSEEQREKARVDFNRGKAPGFDFDAEADKLTSLRYGRQPLLQLFLQIQCMAVAADGEIHPAEHQMLVRLARRLGLTEQNVAQLEALLRAASSGSTGGSGPATGARLADAYTALGLSSDAADAEIKQAYRRLMSQNHPDKLTAKGLPEHMREIAEERSREINVAYDLIKEARGFS